MRLFKGKFGMAIPLVAVTAIVISACGSSTSGAGASGNNHKLSPGGLPAPELPNLKVGILEATTAHDLEVAVQEKLFQKYGLNVSLTKFTSEGAEITALLAGSIDVAAGIGVSEDLASQRTGNPLIAVMTEKDNLSDDLYSSKNVHNAAQLKGKAIAVSSFASVTYGEALLGLQFLGLKPSQVTITEVGDDAARRAALIAGSVGASLNDRSEAPQMESQGAHILAPLANQKKYTLPVSDVITTKAFAKKDPNTVLAVVASLIEGTHIFLTKPSVAITAAVNFEKVSQATAKADVDYDVIGWEPVNGISTLSDFKAALQLFVKSEPSLANVQPTSAFENTFEQKLKALGWYSKNHILAP